VRVRRIRSTRSRSWGSLLATLGILVAGACSPRGERGSSVPLPSDGEAESVTGMVQIVGSAPVNVQVVLQSPGERGIRLTGELADELGRLAGAQVTVRGSLRPSPDPIVSRELEATGYDVVSVNGRPVIMGEVISAGAGGVRIRTADGREVTLVGAPASFAVGQKVWVQGVHSVAVQSYGTVRP
jgi:hypothetical protein